MNEEQTREAIVKAYEDLLEKYEKCFNELKESLDDLTAEEILGFAEELVSYDDEIKQCSYLLSEAYLQRKIWERSTFGQIRD